MDSLPEDEIEAIWSRIKAYIDTKNIKSISKKNIANEIESEMQTATEKAIRQTNPQSNMDFLIYKGFADAVIKSDKVRVELLADNVRMIKVRGVSRFQVAKGTPTYTTSEGKKIRAGQFLSGKSEAEAIKDIEKRAV